MQASTHTVTQCTATLLDEVYTLLAVLAAESGAAADYIHTIKQVIHTAQASERTGFAFTALPLLACQAASGMPADAVPVAAAWRALHIATHLLDEVEDGDVTRISSSLTDPPRVINLATGFIALAQLALSRLPLEQRTNLVDDFMNTLFRMAGGQHHDLERQTDRDLATYTAIMEAKSGAFFAFAARAGAVCAGLPDADLQIYTTLGHHTGILVQLANDWAGLRASAGRGDLALGQRTAPICYALAVASPAERTRLEQLLSHAPYDRDAEAQARSLINALGAGLYMQIEFTRHHQQASAVLAALTGAPAQIAPLRHWVANLPRLR
jgi:geranylgeranyl pyrophosphate synthase